MSQSKSDEFLSRMSKEPHGPNSQVYRGGCHCGDIRLTFSLSASLSHYQVVRCNCSICVSKGYLLCYTPTANVDWQDDSLERCSVYQFNTMTRKHLSCPRCSTSIGIDYRGAGFQLFGISARVIDNVDLNALSYQDYDAREHVSDKA